MVGSPAAPPPKQQVAKFDSSSIRSESSPEEAGRKIGEFLKEMQTNKETVISRPRESGAPESGKGKPIPSGQIRAINARVKDVRFYESDKGTIPFDKRKYATGFDSTKTRFINWELNLEHPQPKQRVNFEIDAIWSTPDGSVFAKQTMQSHVEPNWSNSHHSLGRGYETPGKFDSGNYRVDLFVKGELVSIGSFTIYPGDIISVKSNDVSITSKAKNPTQQVITITALDSADNFCGNRVGGFYALYNGSMIRVSFAHNQISVYLNNSKQDNDDILCQLTDKKLQFLNKAIDVTGKWAGTYELSNTQQFEAREVHIPIAGLPSGYASNQPDQIRPEPSGAHEHLGCFKDQGDPVGTAGRDISGHVVNNPRMTTEMCASICRDKGYSYAGTQYGTWCFCGNSYGKSGTADNCNMPCGGNQVERCGGVWANQVYRVRSSRVQATGFNTKEAGTMPNKDGQIALVKRGMRDFGVSLRAKSMEHFRNNISSVWQRQYTTQKLNDSYGQIIEANLDLSVLNTLEPVMDQEAQINQEGVLVLKGHYATQPSQVYFQQKFIREKGAWKLLGFYFNLE
jgi:hypothetical protein